MSRRRRTKKPTRWQDAKPHIRKILGSELACHGFKTPGVTMVRHRAVFVDVVHVRSKHGNDCSLHFGCDIRRLLGGFIGRGEAAGLVKPAAQALYSGINVHELPDDPACTAEFVESVLLPQVLHMVETWFPRFTDVDSAIRLLEGDIGIINCASNLESACLMMALRRAKQPSMTAGEMYGILTGALQGVEESTKASSRASDMKESTR